MESSVHEWCEDESRPLLLPPCHTAANAASPLMASLILQRQLLHMCHSQSAFVCNFHSAGRAPGGHPTPLTPLPPACTCSIVSAQGTCVSAWQEQVRKYVTAWHESVSQLGRSRDEIVSQLCRSRYESASQPGTKECHSLAGSRYENTEHSQPGVHGASSQQKVVSSRPRHATSPQPYPTMAHCCRMSDQVSFGASGCRTSGLTDSRINARNFCTIIS